MSQQIINAGIDPTSFQQITGAQLKALVSASTFASGIGGIIVTDDVNGLPTVPPANVDATLQTFLWMRISVSAVTLYLWNTTIPSQPTYLNWTTIANAVLGVNTVTGGPTGNLALSTITPDNISSVSGGQIVGSLSASAQANLLTNTTNAGGVLSGTFASLAFLANTLALNILTATGAVNKVVPVIADQVLLFDSATAAPILAKYSTITQIFNNCLYNALASKAVPAAADQVALFDSAATNAPKYSTIPSLLGNVAVKATPIAADSLLMLDSTTSAPTVTKQTTITDLLNSIFPSYKTALSNALAASTSSVLLTATHGLANPVRAEVYLQCVTNDGTYAAGDIVPYMAPNTVSYYNAVFNATNIILLQSSSTSLTLCKKDGSGNFNITFANWKMYAIVYGY